MDTPNTSQFVGFIGLGSMGAAIAARLVESYSVLVHDLNEDAVAHLVAAGAEGATVAELCERSAVILMCLPAPRDVLDVLFGSGNVAVQCRPGTAIVDMTTSSPDVDSDIAERLQALGIPFADAPVTGGPQGATAGTLTIMVGAEKPTFEAIEQVLMTISPNVHHVGGIGAGHAMKLVANMLTACNRVSTLEAVRFGCSNGLSLETQLEVLNRSGGRSYITERTIPMFVTEQGFTPQHFSLGLLGKDVRLATAMAKSLSVDAPMTYRAADVLQQAIEAFGPGADVNEMMFSWLKSTDGVDFDMSTKPGQ